MRFRSIKCLFVLQAAVLGFLVFGSSFRIIELHYPRVIENSPLTAPVKVQSFSANQLVLEDGRTFEISWSNHPDVARLIKESEDLVDLHFYSGSDVEIYAKHQTFICGNTWMSLIQIPLIADNVPRYRRELVGLAKIETQPESSTE
jgi:hypothetical protein